MKHLLLFLMIKDIKIYEIQFLIKNNILGLNKKKIVIYNYEKEELKKKLKTN